MTPDEQIRQAADKAEIRDLISRLAMLTDLGESDAYAQLFAEDAHLEMRAEPGQASAVPPSKGREAILAGSRQRRADGLTGPGTGMVHALQQSMITVTGDTAAGRTYVIICKNAHRTPEPMAMKVYNDAFVRTPEGWRLSVRYIDPV